MNLLNIRRLISPLLVSIFLLAGCSSTTSDRAEIFFVTDTPRGIKLVSELRDYKDAQQALADLINGKTQPLDPDYANLWQGNSSLNNLRIVQNVAEVDISLDSLNVGAEGEQRAIDQIVWTLTAINPDIEFVEFLVNGNSVETFAGHVNTFARFSRQPDYEVLNPLQISSLNHLDSIKNPVVITGEACTFEANVVWTLLRENQPIANNFTTAESACPVRSNFVIELGDLAKGDYLIKVEEFSAEDGSLFAIDDKEFSVR
jgi:hypothetical protein